MATKHSVLDTKLQAPLLADHVQRPGATNNAKLPTTHFHPNGTTNDENGSIYFVGTATTIIEWEGARIMTDPNFLHAGDHVHLCPGVTAERATEPALDLHELPQLDCILLSHYHEDHFDKLVENSINRGFPIITTPHARACLTSHDTKEEPFGRVTSLDVFESCTFHIDPTEKGKQRVIKVTGTPGKHIPPGPLDAINSFLQAVPPTNSWLLKMGYLNQPGFNYEDIKVSYRIYISGDTLFMDELQEITKKLQTDRIDLMLVHLGGTTIPGPSTPLIMVTMDAKQGLQLMELMDPDITIPIHYDDYSVFLSPLSDFKDQVQGAGRQNNIIYLNHREAYNFTVNS